MGTAAVISSAHGEARKNIYGEHASYLRSLGYCPIPANGKKPAITFKTLRGLSPESVEDLAKRHAKKNLAFLVGLCRTAMDRVLVIVDCDDEEAVRKIIELFGDTPGKVRTFHGMHLYYWLPKGTDLGKVHSLRKWGINADVKHGQRQAAIAIAPPSINEKHPGFHYTWEDCDPTVINHLPRFDEKILYGLINKPITPQEPLIEVRADFKTCVKTNGREDSRHLSLRDRGIPRTGPFFIKGDFDGGFLEAKIVNIEESRRIGKEPLDDGDVMEVFQGIWAGFKSGELKPYLGGKGNAMLSLPVAGWRMLQEMSPTHGADAWSLYTLLNEAHTLRCERGETFGIDPHAMARDGSIRDWTRERFEHARNLLLRAGLIICVSPFQRAIRYAAQYKLAEPWVVMRNAENFNEQAAGAAAGEATYSHYSAKTSADPKNSAAEAKPLSQERRAPWLDENISRRAWFERKKAQKAEQTRH